MSDTMTDYRALSEKLIEVERSLRDKQVAIGRGLIDAQAGALRIELGLALLRAKLGIGTAAAVLKARATLADHMEAIEREALDVDCMAYALPRLKESISDELRIINDEPKRKLAADRAATFEATLQEFDRKLKAHQFKTIQTAQPAINELFALARQMGMVQRFRAYLQKKSSAFPLNTRLP